MATKGSVNMTLLDHASRVDESGKILRIVEMMDAVNEIMSDMVVIEGNTQTGHKTGMRTGLPTVAWRQINKGTQPTKSSVKAVEFSAGMIEQLGQVDEELVALASDAAGFRMSENKPQIEAISQELAKTIFYGDVRVNPERFTGLSAYYSALSGVDSSANVINAGGAGSDNTSLWLVVWSEDAIHAFYPRGTQAGISHEDKGKERVLDSDSNPYYAFVDQYKAKLGLAVRDYRQAVRICNIDVSNLATAGDETDTSANIFKFAADAVNRVWNLNSGRAAWYCNRKVKTALDIKALEKANAMVSIETLQSGKPMTRLLGLPVRRCDALLNTEAAVA